MKKTYMISRVVLAVITFVLFGIMLINEDSSWNIVPIIFSLIVFCFSFPSTIFATTKFKKSVNIINNLAYNKSIHKVSLCLYRLKGLILSPFSYICLYKPIAFPTMYTLSKIIGSIVLFSGCSLKYPSSL